ncbi:hypothetical protein FH972_021691 [Carpinus fangiana]|uniref:Uncharacterized protein n=1 Tax=Carpinus fangiana TaxID=176857 RepID=A0A5N6KQ14_9ROSI|nr:hypothetical protein FH972_021691 [Carpinus fangiana]
MALSKSASSIPAVIVTTYWSGMASTSGAPEHDKTRSEMSARITTSGVWCVPKASHPSASSKHHLGDFANNCPVSLCAAKTAIGAA